MKKVTDLNDRRSYYASDDLLKRLQRAIDPDQTIVNVAYSDYGGDFFDKVLIQYFEKNHPGNILVETAAYSGQNAFIFGAIADELLEATERYLLGFEYIEEFYGACEYAQKTEDFQRFLSELNSDKVELLIPIEDALDKLLEGKAGAYNMTTQGVDFCSSKLEAWCIEQGIIRKVVEDETPADIDEYELPAIWASYLVNGDASGLEDVDIEECNRDTQGLGSCVDVAYDEHPAVYKGILHNVATFKFRKN